MKSLNLLGIKKGMTQVFDENRNIVVCSVIQMQPNVIVQLKTKERDGYQAVQLGAFKVPKSKKKNVTKPLVGHFAKAQVEPHRRLLESRLEDLGEFEVGKEIGLDYFLEVKFVDVVATSKGKGFQGVIKRHGFSGGPAAHGSGFHRTGGSTGMRSTPGRCLPGRRMPGRMGCQKVTTFSLKVVKIDLDKQLLLVKGAVPGARNGLVRIRKSMKKST